MTERGFLIAFEGGDGSGKSTQARLVADRLGAVLTRQAGGTNFGRLVRELTLDDVAAGISRRAEALLYMADRAQHVDELVEPALAQGRHVVTDRWAYASLVYQGFGRGLDVEKLRDISDWAMNGLWPDLVVFLDVDVELALERADQRSPQDHYEAEGAELQRLVIGGYRSLARQDPDRWRVVDGAASVEEVANRVWIEVEQFIAAESASR